MSKEHAEQDLRKLVRELQRALKAKDKTIKKLVDQLEKSNNRVSALERELGKSPSRKFDEPFSVEAEERRQQQRTRSKARKKKARKGRVTTADKLKRAARTEHVYPTGVPIKDCKFSHARPIWRLEHGNAVLVAYYIFRGPNKQYGKVDGALGRSEFGIEIFVTLAQLVFVTGLSFDKACSLLNFFQGLQLSKSQADALLKQLSRHWEKDFDTLCTLLANSTVVHADETSWTINSVWAFLSEKARIVFFGVNKDAATLTQILNPDTFGGTVISDDAAVYANFEKSQKCWAHLLRKAIKLTLMEPNNDEYRKFTDGLLVIYRKACRIQKDRRFKDATRERKVQELEDELTELCEGMWFSDLPPQDEEALDDYRRLVNELMRLSLQGQLFTFVVGGDVEQPNGESSLLAGTNNESERELRGPATDRKTGRGSKTAAGARRRTVLGSVLGSLRLYLTEFTLSSVLGEINSWAAAGTSCFSDLLQRLKLPPPEASVLNSLYPNINSAKTA